MVCLYKIWLVWLLLWRLLCRSLECSCVLIQNWSRYGILTSYLLLSTQVMSLHPPDGPAAPAALGAEIYQAKRIWPCIDDSIDDCIDPVRTTRFHMSTLTQKQNDIRRKMTGKLNTATLGCGSGQRWRWGKLEEAKKEFSNGDRWLRSVTKEKATANIGVER